MVCEASTSQKLCECGCGYPTPPSSRRRNGYAAGEPLKFLRGHNGKLNGTRIYRAKLSVDSEGKQTKLCTDCSTHQLLEEFNRSSYRPEGLRTYCKSCERERAILDYKKNPAPYKRRAAVTRTKIRAGLSSRLRRIRQFYGCRKCDETETACLDFHHLEKRKGRAMGSCCDTLTHFERELIKCVVLCANCHRKAHAGLITIEPMLLCKQSDGLPL